MIKTIRYLKTIQTQQSIIWRYRSRVLVDNSLFQVYSYCPLCGICILPKASFHSSVFLLSRGRPREPIVFPPKPKGNLINIWKNMTVLDLANELNRPLDDVFEALIFIDGADIYDSAISPIDDLKVIMKAVKLTGNRYSIKNPIKVEEIINNDAVKRPPADEKDLVPRPPVVTIMGHVDHGKTTLLDSLRQSSIVDSEFGGITQHIGAFEVKLPTGEKVTFLDTPGHAAFSAMRSRGANATDIVVLVVAADDGVSPQTKESIAMAREANVPIIVAINKIDKADANIPRTKEMLLLEGIQLEEQGGDVQAVEISALKGTNITLLVETLVTQAELLNLKSDPKGLIEAIVIESKLEHGRGKLATCVVKRGTMRKGAILVAGTSFAKVRNIFNDVGKIIEKADPGSPAQVIGWRSLPSAGDEVLEVSSERRANEVIEYRNKLLEKEKMKRDKVIVDQKVEKHLEKYREERANKLAKGIRFKMYRGRPPLEKMIKEDLTPRFSVVLKGDVDGSLEAILDVLETYQSDQCPMDILSYGVGPVSANDIKIANDFKGFVYAFNIAVPKDIRNLAKKFNVPIREHNIIYRLIENVQEDISSKMPMLPFQDIVGEAVVQSEFIINDKKSKLAVAGCRCVKGQLKKDLEFQIIRMDKVIHEGTLVSMRHLKNEVSTISKDVDCGLRFADTSLRFQTDDKIVCFKMSSKRQVTDWSPEGF